MSDAAANAPVPVLEAAGIRQCFGGLVALEGVTFRVDAGLIKGIIGPNGAGKTTLFNVLSGVLKPLAGEVRFQGRQIAGWPAHRIAALGMSRTFQNLRLCHNMTALENVMVGRHVRTRHGVAAAALRLPSQRREEQATRAAALQCLADVGLADAAPRPVGALSFGQRRMVELARALATEPRLLLLDEPASGLNTRETDDLAEVIRSLRRRGITMLLVEHDMSLVMEICDDILVLDFGKPIAEGPPAAIRNDPNVGAIYLGGSFDDAAG